MNRILVLDDLRIGMYVTVLNAPEGKSSSSYKGDILKVLGVAYPYVSIEVCNSKTILSFDMREVDILSLNEEFVKNSFPSDKIITLDSFWDNIDMKTLDKIDAEMDDISKKMSSFK